MSSAVPASTINSCNRGKSKEIRLLLQPTNQPTYDDDDDGEKSRMEAYYKANEDYCRKISTRLQSPSRSDSMVQEESGAMAGGATREKICFCAALHGRKRISLEGCCGKQVCIKFYYYETHIFLFADSLCFHLVRCDTRGFDCLGGFGPLKLGGFYSHFALCVYFCVSALLSMGFNFIFSEETNTG